MSKIVNNFHKIHNNTFIFTPLIVEFFKNIKSQPKDIVLAYLVLPLVLYETSRNSLKNSKTKSSISTFSRRKENFYGLQNRIEKYKDITNKCIQHAIDSEFITLTDSLSVNVMKSDVKAITSLRKEFLASSKIYKVFDEYDVVSIYRLLGVKKL